MPMTRNEKKAQTRMETIAGHHSYRRNRIQPRFSIVEEVVRIVQEHPILATRRFRGVTPLTLLIENQASASVIQTFCLKFPEALQVAGTRIRGTVAPQSAVYPLESACFCPQIPPGVIPILAQYYPPTNGPYLSEDQLFNLIFCVLKKFHPNAGQVQQQQQQQHQQDVEAMIHAAIRAGCLTDCTQSERRQFQLLHWAFDLAWDHSATMQFLIRHCPNVSSIIVQRFCGPELSSTVAELIPQLVNLRLVDHWWTPVPTSSSPLPSWEKFTDVLGQNKKLERLHLDFHGQSIPFTTSTSMADQPFTAAVVSLLKHNTLRSLTIQYYPSINHSNEPHEEIFDALKNNTSLQMFDMPCCTDTNPKLKAFLKVLKDNNRTILEVRGIDEHYAQRHHLDPSLPPLIQHRLKLNTMGLAMAHDPHTQFTKLLGLVENAMANNWGARIDGDTAVGFAYALLRPCPSIWLANISTVNCRTQR